MRFIFGIFVLAVIGSAKDVAKRQIGYDQYQPYYYDDAPVLTGYAPVAKKEKGQDFSKIPGVPGVDYPLYHEVPHTNFDCDHVPYRPGMYANVETGCQAYHVCHDGREGKQGASFLCGNGTLFNQHEFTCDWWYNVKCSEAPKYYNLNLDPYKNPYIPKPEDEAKKRAQQFVQQAGYAYDY